MLSQVNEAPFVRIRRRTQGLPAKGINDFGARPMASGTADLDKFRVKQLLHPGCLTPRGGLEKFQFSVLNIRMFIHAISVPDSARSPRLGSTETQDDPRQGGQT